LAHIAVFWFGRGSRRGRRCPSRLSRLSRGVLVVDGFSHAILQHD